MLLVAGSLWAMVQSEGGRIERQGEEATLIVDSPRPVDSAAITLAEQYRMRVSVEDPVYLYDGDVKDVTREVVRTPDFTRRVVAPRGGRLEVKFRVREDGSPEDPAEVVKALVDAANVQFPFGFRMDVSEGWVSLVPARSRDKQGRSIEVAPLLDRRVTIPWGTRSLAESALMMAEQLSRQTGKKVSCCQAGVGGIPWGLQEVAFEAVNEPARDVLKRMIALSLEGRPNPYYWLARCDVGEGGWCFINLRAVPPAPEPQTRPGPEAVPQPGKWFDKTPRLGSPKAKE